MKIYESQFSNLVFYVGDVKKQFTNGKYATNKADEIKVLDAITDAKLIETEKPVVKTEETPKEETKAPVTTAPKRPTRKSSAK